MVNVGQDFALNQLQESVHTDPYVIKKASSNLRAFYEEGKLGELPDWDGDPLEGWMDLLGLNGRPIRQNRVNGVRAHSSRRP